MGGNLRGCVVHQDVQSLLSLQELFCCGLGKFRGRKIKLQKLDLPISRGEMGRPYTFNSFQTLLSVPRSQVDFSTIPGKSLHGFETESRTKGDGELGVEVTRESDLLSASNNGYFASKVGHVGGGVKFVSHDVRRRRRDVPRPTPLTMRGVKYGSRYSRCKKVPRIKSRYPIVGANALCRRLDSSVVSVPPHGSFPELDPSLALCGFSPSFVLPATHVTKRTPGESEFQTSLFA